MTLNELISRLQDIKANSKDDIGNCQVAVKYNISARKHEYRIIQYGLSGVLTFKSRPSHTGIPYNEIDTNSDYVTIEAHDDILYSESSTRMRKWISR